MKWYSRQQTLRKNVLESEYDNQNLSVKIMTVLHRQRQGLLFLIKFFCVALLLHYVF